MIKAQKFPVEIISYDTVDVCNESVAKECTISIYIGNVLLSDSLDGFEFQLTYNPKKLLLNSALYMNTLSEFFDIEYREVKFTDSGFVKGYCTSLNPDVFGYGNKPLIAFKGKYLGECADTAHVNLIKLEFAEYFKKSIDDSGKKGIVVIKEKKNKYFNLSFDADSLKFTKNDSLKYIEVIGESSTGKNIGRLNFEIELKDLENFTINNIESANDKIVLDTIIEESNKKIVKTILLGNLTGKEKLLSVGVEEKDKNGSVSELIITPVLQDECNCIANLKSGKLILKGFKKDSINPVVEEMSKSERNINARFDETNERLKIQSDNADINEISVYDLFGNEKYSVRLNMPSSSYEISSLNFSKGVYFIIVKTYKKEINKICLIKINF